MTIYLFLFILLFVLSVVFLSGWGLIILLLGVQSWSGWLDNNAMRKVGLITSLSGAVLTGLILVVLPLALSTRIVLSLLVGVLSVYAVRISRSCDAPNQDDLQDSQIL